MARVNTAPFAGPRIFAYGDLACAACLDTALVFLGGDATVARFACAGCGLDFDLRAADGDVDYLFDIHHD